MLEVPSERACVTAVSSEREFVAAALLVHDSLTTMEIGMSVKASLVAFLAACMGMASVACAQTFTGGGITINDVSPGSPYPSVINVEGISGFGPSAPPFVVTLHGFTHTWSSDIYVVLEAPSGQRVTLLGRCSGEADTPVDLSFSSSASIFVADASVAGTYRPTLRANFTPFAPLPPGPFGSTLSAIDPASYSGQWKLFVGDVVRQDTGSIASWSITFPEAQTDPQSSTAFTYQGSLAENGVPFNGPAQLRFALMDSETGGNQIGPRVLANVNVANGLFTAPLDFGAGAFTSNQPRFLQIFNGTTALSPRQRISVAPQAISATSATRAASATTADVATLSTRSLGVSNSSGADALFSTDYNVVSNLALVSPDYRYNVATQANRSLHTSSFTPATSEMTYTRNASGLYGTSPGAVVSFAAPLDLPDSANLFGVDVSLVYSGGPPVSVSLVQVDHATGEQRVMGNILVTTPNGLPQVATVVPTMEMPFIENSSYSYALVVNWTTPSVTAGTRIVSARVRYSVLWLPR